MSDFFATLKYWVLLSAALNLFTACATVPERPIATELKPALDATDQTILQRVAGNPKNNLRYASQMINDDALLAEWHRMEGDALIIWRDGKILLETYSARADGETRFRSYSMQKSVVGLIAAMMHDEGLIDLYRPITDYITPLADYASPFTVRDALQHQTGLERYTMFPPSEKGDRLLNGPGIEEVALEALQIADSAVFDYANLNYQLAGAALRAALKNSDYPSYRAYLSKRLWRPIGNRDSYLWSESAQGSPRFYAGLQASAQDWLRLGILIANNGKMRGKQIVNMRTMDEFTRPARSNSAYGLGLWMGSPDGKSRAYGPSTRFKPRHSAPFTYDDVVFFDGFGGQRVYISPAEKLVVVRLGKPRLDWDDAALFNMAAAASAKDSGVSIIETDLSGPNDDRLTTVRLYQPHQPCDCPALVFSHGAFSAPDRYDRLLAPLAQAGITIIAPMHVDSEDHADRDTYKPASWTSNRLIDMERARTFLETRADDTVLEWVAAGHSFGALIAQIIGGATSNGQSYALCCTTKPTHIIALSPSGTVSGQLEREDFQSINAAMTVITGKNDIIPPFAEEWNDHLDSFENTSGPATAIIFSEADHYFNGMFGRQTDDFPKDEAHLLIETLETLIKEGELSADDERAGLSIQLKN